MTEFFSSGEEKKKTPIHKHVLNIAVLISVTVISLRLVIMGFITIDKAVFILIGVLIFVAIGNAYAKLALALISVYLFIKSYTGFNDQAFQEALTAMGAIIIVLIGIYIMLRSFFKQ